MFQHLPTVTEDNLKVVVEKDFPCFRDLLSRCIKEGQTPVEAIEHACSELYRFSNPWLAEAVKTATYHGTLGVLKAEGELGLQAEIMAASILLAALRLIDRALEAKKLKGRS